jgi:pimeloyl-ACP methyl ester carboxylesterase
VEVPRTIWATSDGVRIEALEWSPPNPTGDLGLPLVFVSGASGNARFAEVHGIAAAEGRIGSRSRRVLGVSRRGTGLSDAPDAGYTPARFAGDVAAAIRAAAYERFVLFGQSLGVPIVLEFAISKPNGLAALALGDFPPRYIDSKADGTFASALEQPFEFSSWEAARGAMRRSNDRVADERRWQVVRRSRLHEAPNGTIRALENRNALVRLKEESVAAQTDYRDRLHEIDCPVLVLRAAIPPSLLSPDDVQLYRGIRDVMVESLPTNHSLGQDGGDPSALHRALGRLFDRVDTPIGAAEAPPS